MSLLDPPIRVLKGIHLFWMYAVFGVMILFGALLVVPVLWFVGLLRGPDPMRMQAVIRWFCRYWLRLLSPGGLFRTPSNRIDAPDGPHVIVANHPGLFDVIVLMRDIPRFSVLVKSALPRWLPLTQILRLAGYVVAPADEGFGAVQSTRDALAALENGYSFMIFPEGTRSPKGGMRRFKAGPFKLARKAGVPILPVLIKNDPPFRPKEDHWYYPPRAASTATLELWPPIPAPAEGDERRVARELEARYRKALGLVSSEETT